MPLTPTGQVSERSGDILFAMRDGKKRVVCRITVEALDDVAHARLSTSKDRLGCFTKYRDRILKVASKRYDAGEAKPIVRSADLV